MLARIWRGWTTPANADAYETFLRETVFPGILARSIDGFERIELLRAPAGEEIEFITIMWFTDLDSVRGFAGPDYTAAVVLPPARALLARFDSTCRHFELRETRTA
jgi:hypothetical protein